MSTRKHRKISAALVLAILVGLLPPAGAGSIGETIIDNVIDDSLTAPEPIELPADDAAHDGYFIEWWQWWFHLVTADGRRFGAVVVFYDFPGLQSLGLPGPGARRIDFRITDFADDSAHSGSQWLVADEAAEHVPNGFRLEALGQRAEGVDGRSRVHIEVDGYSLDARAEPARAPVIFFNAGGFYRPTPLESARVYERQRMPTHGTLTKNGEALPVSGTSWFEHGWVNMPSILAVQWDFFHLELDDGRDVQLAQVRRHAGGPVFLYEGTIRDEGGETTYLHEGDFEITPTETWTRDATCSYPIGWRIRLLDQTLTLTAPVKDQEVHNPIWGHYWDGNMVITGDVTGRGIAEPLQYCYTPRLGQTLPWPLDR